MKANDLDNLYSYSFCLLYSFVYSIEYSTLNLLNDHNDVEHMLNYLMVYNEAGLPLYSKCYSDFCKATFDEPILLSGFLTAIENFATELTKGEALESIKMGQTKMFFNKTFPSGHSVVIGLSKDNPKLSKDVFNAVQALLETEYKDIDMTIVNFDFAEEFEKQLLKNALIPALHQNHLEFEDQCPLGDQCPMKTLAADSKKGTIWSIIKKTYTSLRSK
ncbi:MAG: hypothetical protein ACFFCZ_19785 [Promethearchaeota archaeon]